jgi:hypothetical protein
MGASDAVDPDAGPEPPVGPGAAGATEGGLAGALAAARARPARRKGRRDRSSPTWPFVAIGVAGLVLLSVLVAGVFHAFGSGSSNDNGPAPAAPTSFYGSLGPALSTARASYWNWPASGQPELVFAEGLASPVALGAAVNISHLGTAPCAPTLIAGSVGPLPAYAGLMTDGIAAEWLYAFEATGMTLVVVAVDNGSAGVVATTPTNGACYTGPGSFATVPVDSSVASAAAAATDLSKAFFEGAGTNLTPVSAEFYLVPPGYVADGPMGDPTWVVTDTTCLLYGGTGSGTALTTDVDAATGKVFAQSSAAATC